MKEYIIPSNDYSVSEIMKQILPQCKPGALVIYPDGSKYKVPWKPASKYTCKTTNHIFSVYELKPVIK